MPEGRSSEKDRTQKKKKEKKEKKEKDRTLPTCGVWAWIDTSFHFFFHSLISLKIFYLQNIC